MTKSAQIAQRWLEECCEAGSRYKAPTSELFEHFEIWCARRSLKPCTKQRFSRVLTDLGYEAERNGRARLRRGLRLAPPGTTTAGGKIRIPDVPVKDDDGNPAPPPHLSPAASVWWGEIVEEWELEDRHDLMILTLAAEMWDRAQLARTVVEREGLTTVNSHGNVVPRPEERIQERSALAYARLVRELGLDGEAAEPDVRINRLIPRS